jgi:hypothetical protein
MGYLILTDYLAGKIQQTELNAITQNVIQNRLTCELRAQAQILSKLVQRYDFSKEFTSTDAWSPSIAYKAGQRFYLTAAAYTNPGVYLVNDLTLYTDGNVYINTTPIPVGEAFNSAHWTKLGALNAIYSVNYPNAIFDTRTYYNIGVNVWWRDKNYTSLIRSFTEDQEGALQAGQYKNLFLGTVLPDDVVNGAKMWGAGTAFSVAAGTLPSNAAFTLGDNRDQNIVKHYLDMAIYEMCGGVAPQNIPELRKNNWLYSIKCLDAYAEGKANLTLPLIQPLQGAATRYGGKIARQNYY